MKRITPKKRLAAMPDGVELERIIRPFLKDLGRNITKPYLAVYERRKEADPFTGPYELAGKFIPIIDSWIDEAGRAALVSLDQQNADQWLVRNPQILNQAHGAILDLCKETIDTFQRDLMTTLDGMRADLAASIESGETGGELTDRISQWVDENARWRARRIAVTESARAYNLGQMSSVMDLDYIAGFKLLLSADACPMCYMIHRLCPIIRKGGTFGQNGNNPTYKDLKAPPFHPGCRCALQEVFEDEMPPSLKPPVMPGANGYLQPSEADFQGSEEGGYLSVAIGNAKSFTKSGRLLEG